MARKSNKSTPVFWLRSKLGRAFWRFGVHLSPDTYSKFEIMSDDDPRALLSCSERKGFVTVAEARAIEPQLAPIRKGGVLEMTARDPEPEARSPKPEEKKDGAGA